MASVDRLTSTIRFYYEQAYSKRSWQFGLLLFGFLFHILVYIRYQFTVHFDEGKNTPDWQNEFEKIGHSEKIRRKLQQQEENKNKFLGIEKSKNQEKKDVERRFEIQRLNEISKMKKQYDDEVGENKQTYLRTTLDILDTWPGILISLILAWPMYIYLLVISVPTLHYIVNRLIMMIFVIVGVTVIVFTLLYLSPSDPAVNILGDQATEAQYQAFRELHGLNDSYVAQLARTIKGIFTFDLGNAFQGNERVVSSILRRFPVTIQLTLMALTLSLSIALPAGIYAAVKANATFDNLFMFIALIGISIPSFWQGLIFILVFSINLGWLPATYSVNNYLSLLMPAVVLGTGLMASVARMTRSSTLEVINEDYILTARAKGLSNRRVILRHAVPNALIPIVTIIGLQFGGMLGGASVTEKVFNINGIGSYIVDKQFVPDIPSVMGGVIYIAVVLSIVNMFVDVLYSFLDPRIRSRIQRGQQ
ncbi:Dipeptide transport system permease protein DppB [Jeotgalibaca dankookensis]|uniref:Dipeptide transport system permease protein DppB n=1 Tax=Jeotgalibaca dankookensis TaxID=708126 RepID=A0A1S6IQE0_9LACT|nr:ABC transporter permease [Jeotgalibaca dankookensis]AQS53690.1 Dipeptide transport system permease protein DppB [Jeotgalibaca dankookensis]